MILPSIHSNESELLLLLFCFFPHFQCSILQKLPQTHFPTSIALILPPERGFTGSEAETKKLQEFSLNRASSLVMEGIVLSSIK